MVLVVAQSFTINIDVGYSLAYHTPVNFYIFNLSGTKKSDKIINMNIVKEIWENA